MKDARIYSDETTLKLWSEYIRLWVALEPQNSQTLALSTSKERNMFVAGRFLPDLTNIHGDYPIPINGDT